MRQMNAPQLAHGYPSDARSSFPQEPQLIASRSWSLVIVGKILCVIPRSEATRDLDSGAHEPPRSRSLASLGMTALYSGTHLYLAFGPNFLVADFADLG